MAEQKFTPEDRLLNIIEKSKDKKGSISKDIQKQKEVIEIKRKIVSLKNLDVLKLKLWKSILNLRLAVNVLIVVVVLSAGFFIYSFVKDKSQLEERFTIMTKPSVSIAEVEDEEPSIKVDLYLLLQDVKKRHMFTLTPQIIKAKKQSEEIKNVSNFKLVVVLWSNEPQVMIEDSIDKKTYLLKTGESIGRYKIKEIYRDKVVLLDGDEECVLR